MVHEPGLRHAPGKFQLVVAHLPQSTRHGQGTDIALPRPPCFEIHLICEGERYNRVKAFQSGAI
jgi:hypothetical protein